ncbi:hypothetical protein HPE56_08180 [Maribacter sp. ANRC-HE7]|uniref:Uncharacterized protein n=1 Tax=Maribacter aquimaris TaxID=2737171 RepID=A0ABR7V3P2_9FLAO|nr:hypothetical protein [Maribacter aquimaris]MBD0777768.1 hypothetical protein [Maribacter aquimaris]
MGNKTSFIISIFLVMLMVGCGNLKRIIDQPVFIAGGNNGRADNNCHKEFEAVPSAVTNPSGDIAWFASYGTNRMTYAKGSWSNWAAGSSDLSGSGFAVEENPQGPLSLNMLTGDSWTAYSESKNLAFFYFIGRYTDSAGKRSSCVSVAATTPEKLELGEWDFPAACISEQSADQGAILHIDATNTFYAASKLGRSIVIQAFDNCPGAPGPLYGCPETSRKTISSLGLAEGLRFSLAENPCTGNLILTYKKDKEVRLRFYDENLNTINEYVVRKNQPFEAEPAQTNVGCVKGTIRRCGLGGSDCCNPDTDDCRDNAPTTCLRDNGRPSIDTYQQIFNGSPICGAVVAYDVMVEGEDGNLWSKSRLDVVDVTSEESPSIISHNQSTSDKFTWNQYMSYAVVSDNGPNTKKPKIAWFWLTDIRGPCNLIVEGMTSENLGGKMEPTGIISGPFPGVFMSSYGIGDYFRGMKGGDKDGSLYLSWGEPVKSPGCVSCMGDEWNLSTKITRIRWEKIKDPELKNKLPDPILIK